LFRCQAHIGQPEIAPVSSPLHHTADSPWSYCWLKCPIRPFFSTAFRRAMLLEEFSVARNPFTTEKCWIKSIQWAATLDHSHIWRVSETVMRRGHASVSCFLSWPICSNHF
jgi:hypothetical protein